MIPKIDLDKKITSLFSTEGPLGKNYKHYQVREGQVAMAKAVATCFNENQHIAVEAGTGTGKSFAYLLPALLLKNKKAPIVVSTGTIALQEQLIEKDIPQLAQSLNRPVNAILAKGRSNYLCEHRFRKVGDKLASISEDDRDLETLEKMRSVVGRATFSKSNLPGPLSQMAWSQICSESGLCGQGKCKDSPCSFVRARKELRSADIIVVNHSLLFIHLQLLASGVSLLPQFTQLILDEAHHCPDIASELFGIHISNTQLKFYFDQLFNFHKKKGFLSTVEPRPVVVMDLVTRMRDESFQFFESMREWYTTVASENGRILAPVSFENQIQKSLKELSDVLLNWAGSSDNQDEERSFRYHAEKALVFHGEIKSFTEMSCKDAAYWVELGKEGRKEQQVIARVAYIDVSSRIRELTTERISSVIMTSATLATGGTSFDYFRKRMGLEESLRTLIVPSPFDFQKQVALVTHKEVSEPNSESWEGEILGKIESCIDFTKGGVFVLVTSYALLKKIHALLLIQNRYKILAQGLGGSRTELINQFIQDGNAVLVGNQTFWEGIDIPGKALRNIIIPRLPFEVPSHPLQEARYEYLSKKGQNPFFEIALPHAIMRLKQGFGRLVRRTSDMGIVFILDSRIHKKKYGKVFLEALPICEQFVDCTPNEKYLDKLDVYINDK